MVGEVRELRRELRKTEEEITVMTADRGYFSIENIQQEGEGIELLIASERESRDEQAQAKDKVYSLENFDYVKEINSWRCPAGRLLVQEKKQAIKGRPRLRRYACPDCDGCCLRTYCLKPGEERRSLLVKRKQLIRAEMRARLKDPVKQAIYRKRKWVAEQVIGQIKEGMGFKGLTTRGRLFACAQWLLACAVHNILKAVRFIVNLRKLKAMALAPQAA